MDGKKGDSGAAAFLAVGNFCQVREKMAKRPHPQKRKPKSARTAGRGRSICDDKAASCLIRLISFTSGGGKTRSENLGLYMTWFGLGKDDPENVAPYMTISTDALC